MVKSTLSYKRETCRLCDSKDLELVCEFPPVPLAEKYFEIPKDLPTAPVDLYWCNSCKHVQQLDVVDPDILWSNYIFNPAPVMKEHFQDFANSVEVEGLVIDIGSNDGSLLLPFRRKGCKILGVDASKEVARSAVFKGVPTVPGVLTVSLAKEIVNLYGQADLVTAFNVFAHNDDLQGMLEAIKVLMKPDGRFIFEAQYLGDVIDKTLFATLFHEHLSHHSVTALSSWFKRNGLKLVKVERNNIQHGSIIGTVVFDGSNLEADSSVSNFLWSEQDINPYTFKAFQKRVERIKDQITYTGWGYGASHSGPTLQSLLGLRITTIVDDHPEKIWKYSGQIQILPTSKLLDEMPEYCFILAWVHNEKIIQDNQEYLRRGGKLVQLCPDFRVVHA